MEIELDRLAVSDCPLAGELRLSDGPVQGRGRSLASQGIRFPESFRIDGLATRRDGEVLVSGRIEGRVRLECSRCLAPVQQELSSDFTVRFANESDRRRDEEEERGLELESGELDLSYLPAGATALSVEDLVLEQVLLELPVRPLCREDCRGLCPGCGADLNAGDCACGGEEPIDPRLAPLLELRRKLKDE